MPTNRDLCTTLSRSLAIWFVHVAAVAGALGMDLDAAPTVEGAARLLIALLASSGPDDALERTEVYANLPLHNLLLTNVPDELGRPTNRHLEAADVRVPPGAGHHANRMSRSLAGAIAYSIERAINADPHFRMPYMLRTVRRSQAPLAMIGTNLGGHVEEVLLYRRGSDGEQAYTLASFNLSILADCHGIVMVHLADLLRPAASVARASEPAAAEVVVSGGG